jgi:hypothetical protein
MISYLATPYSCQDPLASYIDKVRVENENFETVTHVAGLLLTKYQKVVFSPITMCHPIALRHALPGDFEFWMVLNGRFLEKCSELLVVGTPGWAHSRGVNWELGRARELGLPITIVLPYGTDGLLFNPA